MSILLRKELRLLLPAWMAALAAATAPLWLGRDFQGLAVPYFGLAILFLGLMPFGQEMSWGTFGLLLSQPEKRERFWRTKTGLLALALLSAWAMFALCWRLGSRHLDQWHLEQLGSFTEMAGETGLLTLLAFSGGLWSTLLLREVTTAIFATVLAPLAVTSVTLLCVSGSSEANWAIITVALEVYAVVGFFVARRLFLGAEDVAWTGGQISLASARGRSFRWLAFGFQERRGPWSALIFKELRLQEVTTVFVPLLVLLHLASLAVRQFAPQWAANMGYFDMVGFLWMVAPVAVGCVAVAEERRYNTLEGFLCLPVRKRNQFAVKFAVAMALGTVLGGVFPWVLENIGGGSHQWIGFDPLMGLVSAAAGVTAVAFFASTMSRSTLQGLTVALLFPSVLCVACFSLLVRNRFGETWSVVDYGRFLFPSLALPSLLIAYFWLAFRNYKCLQTGWRCWAGNFTGFVAVYVSALLVATAIYNRPWEYFMDLEPHHGPARLSGPGRAMISRSRMDGDFYVLLPDGRLWAGKTDQIRPDRTWKKLSGHFVGGSNWVDLADNYADGAALRADGTLWRLSRRANPGQIGSGSDWKKVVAGESPFLALKQDGTLWGWGDNDAQILADLPEDKDGRAVTFPDPVQVWPDSDWVDVFVPCRQEAVAVKRDGSVWKWGYDGKTVWPVTNHPSYHRLVRVNLEGTNWSSIADDYCVTLGVRSDGSLWAGGLRPVHTYPEVSDLRLFGTHIPQGVAAKPVRIGEKTDWLSVSMSAWQFVALEADGAVWVMVRDSLETKRPSKYHDWLAATPDRRLTWALAKDGTVCCWADFFFRAPDYDTSSNWFALRLSRGPRASINILDAK